MLFDYWCKSPIMLWTKGLYNFEILDLRMNDKYGGILYNKYPMKMSVKIKLCY